MCLYGMVCRVRLLLPAEDRVPHGCFVLALCVPVQLSQEFLASHGSTPIHKFIGITDACSTLSLLHMGAEESNLSQQAYKQVPLTPGPSLQSPIFAILRGIFMITKSSFKIKLSEPQLKQSKQPV